jgi:dipeptidyl aminopeptidase/acylaminoacyl peptidase
MPIPTDTYATTGAAAAPAFSCDGGTVFHLRGAGAPQLWAVSMDGTGARAVAAPDEKVAFLRRAPKDDRLIFGIDAGGDERQQLWLVEGGTVRPLTRAPGVIHDFGAWSPDGSAIAYTANDRDEAHMDVLVHTLGGETRRLHQGTHILSVAGWHPDGDRLAFVADAAHGDQALSVLDIASGAVRAIPHRRPAAFKSVRWAKDGSHLQALSDGGGEFLALCRVDIESGTVTPWIAAPGRDIEAWSLSADGAKVATVENDRGFTVLRVTTTQDGIAAAVKLPEGVVADLAWSPDGTTLAFSASTPTQPPGLCLYDVTTQAVRTLWEPEAPAEVRPFTLVSWPSFDGRTIPGWFATPAGTPPAAGWPAVVWVHGGPEGQTRGGWRPDMQMLLNQGYAVLMPNARGSTGYGRTSTALDDVEKRLDSVHDLAAAHAWLIAQPAIDEARIGIMGQSYGGYMVLAAITEYPALWKAAVDYYGIGDFTTLLAGTGPWRRSHRAREYGDPVRDAALFARISPIHHADRITAPLLVLHGTRDPRVPYGESEQIVAALRRRGHNVTFESFDYAGHGFIRRDDRCRAYAAVAEFFGHHL